MTWIWIFLVLLFDMPTYIGIPKTSWPPPPHSQTHMQNDQNGCDHTFEELLYFFIFYFPISIDFTERQERML